MRTQVITFTTQLGAPGTEIARLAAERLGFTYYDWEITSRAAEHAGVSPETIGASEQAQTLLEHVVEHLSRIGVYQGGGSIGPLSSSTMATAIEALRSKAYREFVEKTVLEIGERGEAVIIGHAAQVVLANTPGVLKVMITGSLEQRAGRVAHVEHVGSEEAQRLVMESDQERRAFFRQTYNVDLGSIDLYDIVLNTDGLMVEDAVAGILATAGATRTDE